MKLYFAPRELRSGLFRKLGGLNPFHIDQYNLAPLEAGEVIALESAIIA